MDTWLTYLYNGFIVGAWDEFTDIVDSVISLKIISYGPLFTGGDVWTLMCSIAASLIVIFFIVGVIRQTMDMRQMITGELLARELLRLTIVSGVIAMLSTLITDTIQIGSSLAEQVAGEHLTLAKMAMVDHLAEGRASIVDSVGNLVATIIFTCVLLIGGAGVFLAMYKIAKTVIMRLFKILCLIPLAPIAIASFAGDEKTSRIGKGYVKMFLCLNLELSAIVLAMIASSQIAAVVAAAHLGGSNLFVNLMFNLAVPFSTSAMVEGTDRLLSKALNL